VVLLTGCQNSLENAAVHAIDANGVTHTSPGRQPWVEGQKTKASAESAIHWASEAGRWPAINSTYKPTQGFTRASPWAGMNQAFGLKATVGMKLPQWVR